tara:strand:+ start:592 stop:927 length:336 start_codon:yes stop_codon:yes gene_type:complete
LQKKSEENGARSYKGNILGDNMVLHINLRFLLNAFVVFGSIIYGYYRIEMRIRGLEQGMEQADNQLAELIEQHEIEESAKFTEMEKELQWYQKELNLNPLSWKKNKRQKKR